MRIYANGLHATPNLFLSGSGIVGIGDPTPGAMLQVHNAGSNQVVAVTGVTNPYLTIGTSSNTGGFLR